jgi:hypothetical protein
MGSDDGHAFVVSAGAISGGERELGAGGHGVADSGIGPGVQDQDHGIIKGALTRATARAAATLTREPSRRPTSG